MAVVQARPGNEVDHRTVDAEGVDAAVRHRADVGHAAQPIIESSMLITRVRYLHGDIHGAVRAINIR
jgi:hypothetical protein